MNKYNKEGTAKRKDYEKFKKLIRSMRLNRYEKYDNNRVVTHTHFDRHEELVLY